MSTCRFWLRSSPLLLSHIQNSWYCALTSSTCAQTWCYALITSSHLSACILGATLKQRLSTLSNSWCYAPTSSCLLSRILCLRLRSSHFSMIFSHTWRCSVTTCLVLSHIYLMLLPYILFSSIFSYFHLFSFIFIYFLLSHMLAAQRSAMFSYTFWDIVDATF